MGKLQSRDRRQPGQATASSDRPGEDAAVQGQGGSLVQPRQAATDLVEKLQSRDRDAAWSVFRPRQAAKDLVGEAAG